VAKPSTITLSPIYCKRKFVEEKKEKSLSRRERGKGPLFPTLKRDAILFSSGETGEGGGRNLPGRESAVSHENR